ncbi:MAG: S-methyl-5'-thioadenosine phosphorylase [Peptococcaceae bacterium]
MRKADFAVIGGTGVYNPNMLTESEDIPVDTPFGTVNLKIGRLKEKTIAFLPRHGARHSVPPHKINYRANIMALGKIGVKKVIATAAVGSLNREMEPGHLVLIDQFIDFTKGRIQTFYEGGARGVLHVDMSNPYCPQLRQAILASCPPEIKLHNGGNYVCTEGPRFETPAEINMFRQWEGDLVGMTSVPEVVLAKELGLCYAGIAMVTNFAAGISPHPLTHQEVVETMQENTQNLQKLIMETLNNLDGERSCFCPEANKEAGNFS